MLRRGRHIATRNIAWVAAVSAALSSIATFASARAEEPQTQCGGDCATLLAVEIEGAHALPRRTLAEDYASYLTKPVSQTELVLIADAITQRYRRNGYFLSRAIVPSQDLSSGVARIVVVEGIISEVAVEGPAAEAVRPLFRDWDTARAAHLPELDRRLSLATDLPGVSVRTQIEPDLDNPSNHRLVVDAQRDRVSGYASADNRGDNNTGPWQAYGRVNFAAPFMDRDVLGVGLFTTPGNTNEFRSLEISYGYWLRPGTQLWASAAFSQAHDGADMGSPPVGGDGQVLSLGLEHPLMRQRRQSWWVSTRFDATDLRYDWLGGGGYSDVLRVVRIGLRGFLSDDGRATNVFVEGSFGLDALGASDASVTRRSRWNANAAFGKLYARASHYSDIGERFGVYGEVAGQLTVEPLLYSEQFALGGLPFGRAYHYGELSGDSGIGGSLEGRFGFDPSSPAVSFLQVYAFGDAGVVWFEGANGGSASLASAGAGVRATFDDRYTVRAESARPLTRTPQGDDGKDWRHYLGISASF